MSNGQRLIATSLSSPLPFYVIVPQVFPVFSILYSSTIVAYFNPSDSYMRSRTTAYMVGFFILAVLSGALIWMQTYLFTTLGEKLTRRLRGATFQSILRQPVGWFDLKEHSTGRLTSRLASDAALVKATVRSTSHFVFSGPDLSALLWFISFTMLICVAAAPLAAGGGAPRYRHSDLLQFDSRIHNRICGLLAHGSGADGYVRSMSCKCMITAILVAGITAPSRLIPYPTFALPLQPSHPFWCSEPSCNRAFSRRAQRRRTLLWRRAEI